jgi:hypothetical protein
MPSPALSLGASFHMRMFGISPEDFFCSMTAVFTATAMKKFGMILQRRFNQAKDDLIR